MSTSIPPTAPTAVATAKSFTSILTAPCVSPLAIISSEKRSPVATVRLLRADLSTHYPPVHAQEPESRRTVVLAALMYALRLSCSAASHLLKVLGAEVSKTTVWRDAQEAGETLRAKRPAGRVRVLGADETVFGVKARKYRLALW
jgi:hypothetical protein